MKTLVVLLLLAVALGAGHWTAQRPGEGLDAFVDEASEVAVRVGDEVREGVRPAMERALAALPSGGTDAPSGDLPGEAGAGATVPVVPDGANASVTVPAEGAPAAQDAPARLGGALPSPGEAPDGARSLAAASAEALDSRVAALENELTRTMTASESSVVQSRLDDAERRMVETERRLEEALAALESGPGAAALGDAAPGNEPAPARTTVRLDALDGRLELLGRRLDEGRDVTRASAEGLDDRLDALATRLERIEDDHARSSAALGARVDAFAERAETLDARIGTLSPSAAGALDAPRGAPAPAQTAAGRALAATSLRVAALDAGAAPGARRAAPPPSDALSGVDRRLAALELKSRADGSDPAQLARLDASLAALGERLDAIAERDARRGDALEALEASVGELATRSDALSIDAVQGRVREELASLAEELGTDAAVAGADNAALVAALEATRERVAELEERVRELPASSPAADGAQQTQSALESQIRALGKRIETLPRSPDASLVDDLDEVRERVRELSTQGFVTQEELREQVAGRNVEYKIYFAKNSTEIGDEAARVLDSFIAQETNRTSGVSIFGFTDTKGSASYNQQLAQRRAANVRSYLIRNGFDYTKIDNVAGLGEDAATAILGDEQEDAGQRVVVLFAAQL